MMNEKLIIQHCVIYTKLSEGRPAVVSTSRNLSQEELDKLALVVFPKGTGWSDYVNSRSIKVFPFEDKFVISYVTLAPHKILGVQRRAWVILIEPTDLEIALQQEDWIHTIFENALSLFKKDENSSELETSLALYHQPVSLDSETTKRIRNRIYIKYQKPTDWRNVEEKIRQLVEKSLVRKKQSITTFSLELIESDNVTFVGFPSNNPATQETFNRGLPRTLRLPLLLILIGICGLFAFLIINSDDFSNISELTPSVLPLSTATAITLKIDYTPAPNLEDIFLYLSPISSSQPIYQLSAQDQVTIEGIGVENEESQTSVQLLESTMWVYLTFESADTQISGWTPAQYLLTVEPDLKHIPEFPTISLDTSGSINPRD